MESKKKMLFIFNPFSGKAQIKSKLFEIIDVFVKGGYEVIVHPDAGSRRWFRKDKGACAAGGSRCLQRGRRNTG